VSTPVVVVGAGVAGLSAALAVASLGVDVLVLESRRTNATVDRGDVLQPGIVPVLERIGAREAIDARDPLLFGWFRILDAGGRVQLCANTVERLGHGQFFRSLHHREILAGLEQAARSSGRVEIRIGDHVTGTLLRRGRVVGVRSVSGDHLATLTVVAAGGHAHFGDQIVGQARIQHYGSAFVNARVATDLGDRDAASYVLGPRGATVLVPLPGNEFRVGLQLREVDLRQLSMPGFFEAECASRYRPLADTAVAVLERPRTYRLGRTVRRRWAGQGIVVVGDAAHQVHPVGGQGMNLAIRDASCLAHILSQLSCWDDTGLDDVLQRYAATRRSAVGPVQNLTHRLGRTADRRISGSRLGGFGMRHMPKTVLRHVVDMMLDVR